MKLGAAGVVIMSTLFLFVVAGFSGVGTLWGLAWMLWVPGCVLAFVFGMVATKSTGARSDLARRLGRLAVVMSCAGGAAYLLLVVFGFMMLSGGIM